MKIALPLIATAGILTLTLAGCTGGGGTSTSGTATTAPKSNGSSSNATYSADDLVTILKKANATLNAGGTIKDNAQLVAALGKLGAKNPAELFAGAKITPASCLTALDNALPSAKKFTASGGVEASLTSSKYIVGALSNPSGALPTSITGSLTSDLDGLYSNCGEMKINAGSVHGSIDITKVAATTTADKTYAYSEDISIGGSSSKTIAIEAVYGNLFISVVSLGSTLAESEAAVNAVVAAAKG